MPTSRATRPHMIPRVTRAAEHRAPRVLAAALILCALTVPATFSEATGASAPRDAVRTRGVIAEFRVTGDVPETESLGTLHPEALAVDHRGNLLIADTGNHRVLTVSRDGRLLSEFGGYGWDVDRLDTPSDLSVYAGFFTYVLDEGNRRVARYDVEGDYVDLVVAEDQAGSPVAVDVSPSGGLLLVDADSQSVLSFSQFDETLEPVGRFGLDEGGLLDPRDVAAGPNREVAVADRGRFSVEVFDEFGARLYSLAAADTLVPDDLVFDRLGNIIVADGMHNRLLAFPRGGGPPTAMLTGTPDFRFTALAAGAAGELVAMDGVTGRIRFVELVYAGNPFKR